MGSAATDLPERLRSDDPTETICNEAAAEIERLRAEVTRLEAVITLQQGSMHQRQQRDEYETISFEWNVPPSGPGHEDVSRETPGKED